MFIVTGRLVELCLTVRRFFCVNSVCGSRTFAEQVAGLTRRVVDLIPGRDASPLAEWLLQHESPAVICRDRASSYAEGARTEAPDAVQVADPFHLWQNLAIAVERLVAKHKGCLPDARALR